MPSIFESPSLVRTTVDKTSVAASSAATPSVAESSVVTSSDVTSSVTTNTVVASSVPTASTTVASRAATGVPAAKAKKLTPKQEVALNALLTNPTQEAAAHAAGISTITLWRYLKQGEFRDAYEAARREVTGETVTELQRSGLNAVKTLNAIFMNEQAAVTARVNAAKAVLDMSFRASDLADFKARLEAVEQAERELAG